MKCGRYGGWLRRCNTGGLILWQLTWLVVTEVQSTGARYAPWRVLLVITTLYYVAVLSMHRSLTLRTLYFWPSSMVSHTFSVRCMYSKFGHHPCPLGYLCAKFRFFCYLHCWASPRRKIAYSVNHSLTHPDYLMPREPKVFVEKWSFFSSIRGSGKVTEFWGQNLQ